MADMISRFYQIASGYEPYPYQRGLAQGAWPDLLEIPTGLGKTAAVIMAWLIRRAQKDKETPRRLVWCLPMRVLVEQTAQLAETWVGKLDKAGCFTARRPGVVTLMGGAIDRGWDTEPERDCIIIGTQDQLLSRALNRGYAMSRYRWPVDFALLNNDCLWVFDEVQLMGAGLETSAQLHAFRERFHTFFPCRSLWCSATLNPRWLATVDFKVRLPHLKTCRLSEEDKEFPQVKQRITSSKKLFPLEEMKAPQLAETILREHKEATRTLVIVNTVKDAAELYSELQKKKPNPVLVLLHSRFRPQDRQIQLRKLLEEPPAEGTIIISTQVVEAGVDVSAATLFTALAPWSSLVQRFGRCNRAGEHNDARIFWLDKKLTDRNVLPYTREALEQARSQVQELSDACPRSLLRTEETQTERQVLRAPDLLDLFDTTPDLAGADIDISRFIRDSSDSDVQVFWRSWKDQTPESEAAAAREELCSVPVGEFREFLGKAGKQAWLWDALEGVWKRAYAGDVYPGRIFLLHSGQGGYTEARGWQGAAAKQPVPVVNARGTLFYEANAADTLTCSGWCSLEQHIYDTERALSALLKEWKDALTVPPEEHEPTLPERYNKIPSELHDAARHHDWGKVHPVFREALPETEKPGFQAKAPCMKRYSRTGFRHELASALAMLQTGHSDLACYLAAAHHGRVRLSLRSLPDEKVPPHGERFARGIYEGDSLPPVTLTLAKSGRGEQEYSLLPVEKVTFPAVTLSLGCMELGRGAQGESWTARMLALLEEFGPFRLAFLEMLLRVADWRASAGEKL